MSHCCSRGRTPAAHAARISHSDVCADATLSHVRLRARSLARPHMRRRARAPARAVSRGADTCAIASRSRTCGGSRGRPPAAYAARIARSCGCAGGNVAARAASHANALAATRADARTTRFSTRCLTSVLTHATSLSEKNTLSLAHLTTENARGLNRALLRVCGRNAVAHAASRAGALAATRAHPRTRCLGNVRTHASSLSKSDAL